MLIDPKYYRLPIAYILDRAGIDSVKTMLIGSFILLPIAAYLISKISKRTAKISWLKVFFVFAFILFIVYETIIRRHVTMRAKFNLWPFLSYFRAGNKKQILSNILVFIPFGFLLNWSKRIPFKKALFACCLVSLSIEIAQLIFHTGVFETDDVINNALGGSIGYWYFELLSMLKRRFARGVDKRIDM
ncbi:MAG: VanZ family protein [Clostridia bacterium]|nr:VanZ family protein [Clostridia bacterium]